MTNYQFKKGLQSELDTNAVSFRNRIVSVKENDTLNTVIVFQYEVDPEAFIWLNKRFSNGVRTKENKNEIIINHPNEAPKKGASAEEVKEETPVTVNKELLAALKEIMQWKSWLDEQSDNLEKPTLFQLALTKCEAAISKAEKLSLKEETPEADPAGDEFKDLPKFSSSVKSWKKI